MHAFILIPDDRNLQGHDPYPAPLEGLLYLLALVRRDLQDNLSAYGIYAGSLDVH
jgi:hypothetical protein